VSKEPLRIIVADDNVDNADSMAAYLRLCGCDVVAVYHPLDIVSKAVEFEPHLIFLDIVMPGLDGYQVVTQLRATPSLSDIKIVALTGLARPEERKKGADAGFDGYLIKPTDPAEIDRLIDGLRPAADS
jgi:CheY-like chemotaxis protein